MIPTGCVAIISHRTLGVKGRRREDGRGGRGRNSEKRSSRLGRANRLNTAIARGGHRAPRIRSKGGLQIQNE